MECLSKERDKSAAERDLVIAEAARQAVQIAKQLRVINCAHCSSGVVIGPGTGRRADAQYCSTKCRVYASRARQASEEPLSPRAKPVRRAQAPAPDIQPAFFTKAEVCRITRLSAATIWRKCKNGSFPRSVKLSEKKVGWPVGDIHAWIAGHP